MDILLIRCCRASNYAEVQVVRLVSEPEPGSGMSNVAWHALSTTPAPLDDLVMKSRDTVLISLCIRIYFLIVIFHISLNIKNITTTMFLYNLTSVIHHLIKYMIVISDQYKVHEDQL